MDSGNKEVEEIKDVQGKIIQTFTKNIRRFDEATLIVLKLKNGERVFAAMPGIHQLSIGDELEVSLGKVHVTDCCKPRYLEQDDGSFTLEYQKWRLVEKYKDLSTISRNI